MGGCDSSDREWFACDGFRGDDYDQIDLDKVLAHANTGDLIFFGESSHWNEVGMLIRYKNTEDSSSDDVILFEVRGVNYAEKRLRSVMAEGRGSWDTINPDTIGTPRVGYRQLTCQTRHFNASANVTAAEKAAEKKAVDAVGIQDTVRRLMKEGNMSASELKNEIETQTESSLPANLGSLELLDTLSAELILILARWQKMVPAMLKEADTDVRQNVRFHKAADFMPGSVNPVQLQLPYSYGPVNIVCVGEEQSETLANRTGKTVEGTVSLAPNGVAAVPKRSQHADFTMYTPYYGTAKELEDGSMHSGACTRDCAIM